MNDLIEKAEGQFGQLSGPIAQICTQGNAVLPTVVFPNKEAYLEADNVLAEIQRTITNIEKRRKELTDPLNFVKDQIMTQAKNKAAPLLALKEELRKTMGTYCNVEEVAVREEQRKRDADERKKREDALLEKAVDAEKNGNGTVANNMLNQPLAVPKSKVATANDEAKSSRRLVWKINVDKMAFLKAVVDGVMEDRFVLIDETAIKRVVIAREGKGTIPGVTAYQEYEISGRQ